MLNKPDRYWSDKAVVITGGARGQGAAGVKLLLEQGARVYALDVLPLADPGWRDVQEFAAGTTGDLICLSRDVTAPQTWSDLAEDLGKADRKLFGLVNNAGVTGKRNVVTATQLDEWNSIMAVNVTAPFMATAALGNLMPSGASIVNIGSISAMLGYYSAAYTTSKWALRGLTRTSALELSARGVRVNCVCPGAVDTPMLRSNERLFAEHLSSIPLNRPALPSDIANVVLFLLGPTSAYMTGTDVVVDGGLLSGGIYLRIGRATGALAEAEQ